MQVLEWWCKQPQYNSTTDAICARRAAAAPVKAGKPLPEQKSPDFFKGQR